MNVHLTRQTSSKPKPYAHPVQRRNAVAYDPCCEHGADIGALTTPKTYNRCLGDRTKLANPSIFSQAARKDPRVSFAERGRR